MILNNIDELPDYSPIFKISGRYFPNNGFDINKFKSSQSDFTGKIHGDMVSTRAYGVASKAVWEKLLVLAVEDMISYFKGARGLRGTWNNLMLFVGKEKPGVSQTIAIERAFARIIKKYYSHNFIEALGIEGAVAGSSALEVIKE